MSSNYRNFETKIQHWNFTKITNNELRGTWETRKYRRGRQSRREKEERDDSKGNKRCFPDVFVIHFVLYLLTLYRPEKFVRGTHRSVPSHECRIHSWTQRANVMWLRNGILWFSSTRPSTLHKWEKISSIRASKNFSRSIDTFSQFSISSRLHRRLMMVERKQNFQLLESCVDSSNLKVECQRTTNSLQNIRNQQWITCMRRNEIPRSTTSHNFSTQ